MLLRRTWIHNIKSVLFNKIEEDVKAEYLELKNALLKIAL